MHSWEETFAQTRLSLRTARDVQPGAESGDLADLKRTICNGDKGEKET